MTTGWMITHLAVVSCLLTAALIFASCAIQGGRGR